MLIEQKLLIKLQPHADRIASGSGNDFDCLPAVLLQVVEGQRKQAQAVIDTATTVARKLDKTETSVSAVKTTAQSRSYLCRIKCDGARYHSGWRARTSDVWRQEILESKGWRILRIWSTEWFSNPAKVKTSLTSELLTLRGVPGTEAQHLRHQFIHREGNPESELKESFAPFNTDNSSTSPEDAGEREIISEEIEVGDRVKYEYCETGKLASVQIVNGNGDPSAGSINKNAALAQALLGAIEGEEVFFLSPTGEVRLTIRSIHRPVN